MKFESEIPIGLDARHKKRQGGQNGPPMGLGLKGLYFLHLGTPLDTPQSPGQ